MICVVLDEIRSVEQVLKKSTRSSEQFFLQMGQQLMTCRSRTRAIGDIETIISVDNPAKQLSFIEPDLLMLKTEFSARNQSIDCALQQTLMTLDQCMQYSTAVSTYLRDLSNLHDLTAMTEPLDRGDTIPLDTGVQSINNSTPLDLLRLEKTKQRLLRYATQSNQTFERLQYKTGIQHNILQYKAEALLACEAGGDQQLVDKDKLAEQGRLINKQMDELVSWMQVDDSARQKIEHVNQALADLRMELERMMQTDAFFDQAAVTFLQAEVCKLQVEHLRFAQGELAHAAEEISGIYSSIESSCENIVIIVRDIKQRFSSRDGEGLARLDYLLGQFHDGLAFNSTEFDILGDCQVNLQREIKAITDIRERLNQEVVFLKKSLALAIGNVSQTDGTAARMTGMVKEVEQTTGRSLDLMNDLSGTFTQIIDDCYLFSDAANRLKYGAISSNAELREKTNIARQKIRTAIRNINQDSNTITQDIDTLRSDLHSSNSALSGIQSTLQMMQDAKIRLEQISTGVEELNAGDLNIHVREILDRFSRRYTMLSERQTHSHMTTGSEGLEEETSRVDSGSEFGANIELF